MYLFISENEVIPYKNEVLKRYIGKRLVKTIANPTNEDLKEFGYMEMVESEMPTIDAETQYLSTEYEVVGDKIYCKYIIGDLPAPTETEEEYNEIINELEEYIEGVE